MAAPVLRYDPVPWYDPVVLSTLVMFGWLLIAVLLGALYRPARRGRKVAYLTVVSFVFLLIVLGVGLAFDTQHWGSGKGEGGRGKAEGGELEVSHAQGAAMNCHRRPPTAHRQPPCPGGVA